MYMRMNRRAKPPTLQEPDPASVTNRLAQKETQLANINTLEKEIAADIEDGQLTTDALNSHNDI